MAKRTTQKSAPVRIVSSQERMAIEHERALKREWRRVKHIDRLITHVTRARATLDRRLIAFASLIASQAGFDLVAREEETGTEG